MIRYVDCLMGSQAYLAVTKKHLCYIHVIIEQAVIFNFTHGISCRSGWVRMMSPWVASRGEEELREKLMEY